MPVDISKETVYRTKGEDRILKALAAISGASVSFGRLSQIMEEEGSRANDMMANVKVHLTRLRKKLRYHTIENTRGVGWMLVPIKPPPEQPHADPSEMAT